MPDVCSAYDCTNRRNRTKDISYFKFPLKNKSLTKLWVLKMRRGGWYPTQNSRLCSKHFEERYMYKTNDQRRLIANAVPSIFSFTPHVRKKKPKALPREPETLSDEPDTPPNEHETHPMKLRTSSKKLRMRPKKLKTPPKKLRTPPKKSETPLRKPKIPPKKSEMLSNKPFVVHVKVIIPQELPAGRYDADDHNYALYESPM